MGEILRCASGPLIQAPENNGNVDGIDGNRYNPGAKPPGEIIYYLPINEETIGKVIKGEVTVRGRDVRDGIPVFVATKPLSETKM